MPDNLRDRIAAAITDGIIAGDGHGKIADAIIESLPELCGCRPRCPKHRNKK